MEYPATALPVTCLAFNFFYRLFERAASFFSLQPEMRDRKRFLFLASKGFNLRPPFLKKSFYLRVAARFSLYNLSALEEACCARHCFLRSRRRTLAPFAGTWENEGNACDSGVLPPHPHPHPPHPCAVTSSLTAVSREEDPASGDGGRFIPASSSLFIRRANAAVYATRIVATLGEKLRTA